MSSYNYARRWKGGKGLMSFNPCFSGCRVTTYELNMDEMLSPGVSILVLVDVELQRAAIGGLISALGQFQSLF